MSKLLCRNCNKRKATGHCGHGCDAVYCSNECAQEDYSLHRYECIDAQPQQQFDLERISIVKVLGEGAFGCVIQSSDNRYAIKIQETAGADTCTAEAAIQQQMGAIPYVSVPKVYFYSSAVRSVPNAWRQILSTSCKKAPAWRQQNWQGRFCITVMEFLSGGKAERVTAQEMPAFAFALIYTINKGYKDLGFQHMDLKVDNVRMIPNPSGKAVFKSGDGCTWSFSGVTRLPKVVDFGLSGTRKYPKNLRTGSMGVVPPKQLLARLTGGGPPYHWSCDYFAIGMTMMNSVLGSDTVPYAPTNPNSQLVQQLTAELRMPDQQFRQQAAYTIDVVLNMCVLNAALGNGSVPRNPLYMGRQGSFGQHIFATYGQQIDAEVRTRLPHYNAFVKRFRDAQGDVALSIVKTFVQFNQDKRFVEVRTHPFFAKYVRCPARAAAEELDDE